MKRSALAAVACLALAGCGSPSTAPSIHRASNGLAAIAFGTAAAPTVGETLTTTNGTWTNSPTSFAYQWQRCQASCSSIAGASANSYTVATADVGFSLRVTVTARNAGGSASQTSSPTGVVTQTGGLPSGVTLQAIDGKITTPIENGVSTGTAPGTYAGATFYGAWGNGLPASSAFFPIANFNQPFGCGTPCGASFDQTQVTAYRAMGVNVAVTPYNGVSSQLAAALHAAGIYAINDQSGGGSVPTWDNGTSHDIAGNSWFDEADGNNRCGDMPSSAFLGETVACNGTSGRTPTSAITEANADEAGLHAKGDPTRMRYCQYTKPVADLEGITAASATAYEQAQCDIVSYDSYLQFDGFADDGGNHDLWRQYATVAEVRQQAGENTQTSTPASVAVWPFIEFGEPFTNAGGWDGLTIKPAQIMAEAWNAILGGARGIEWFDHDFGSSCAGGYAGSGTAMIDGSFASACTYGGQLQAYVKNGDAAIEQLAAILNDPFANGYITAATNPHTSATCGPNGNDGGGSGSANTMVKYDQASNSFVLFAAPCYSGGSESVTFTLAGNYAGSVTDFRPVDGGTNGSGSNGPVTVAGHQLTLTFADSTDVHYVIIPNG